MDLPIVPFTSLYPLFIYQLYVTSFINRLTDGLWRQTSHSFHPSAEPLPSFFHLSGLVLSRSRPMGCLQRQIPHSFQNEHSVSWSRWKELRRIMLSCPCPAAPALSPLSTLTGRDVSYFNESSWLLPLGFQAGVQPMNIFQLVFWRRFLYWLTIADFPWAILFLQQVLEVKESNAAGIAMKHELKQDSAWQQLRAGSAPAVSSQSSELPEPWPAGSQPSLSYYGTEHGWVCPQSWDFINPNPRVRCSSCPTCCQHTDSSSPTPPNPHK